MIGPQWLRSSRPLLPTARGSTVPRPVATFLALPSSAMPALSDAATHPGRTSHAGAWDIKLIKLFLERVYELLVGATPPLKSPLITPPSLRRRRSLPPPYLRHPHYEPALSPAVPASDPSMIFERDCVWAPPGGDEPMRSLDRGDEPPPLLIPPSHPGSPRARGLLRRRELHDTSDRVYGAVLSLPRWNQNGARRCPAPSLSPRGTLNPLLRMRQGFNELAALERRASAISELLR